MLYSNLCNIWVVTLLPCHAFDESNNSAVCACNTISLMKFDIKKGVQFFLREHNCHNMIRK